MSSKKVRTSVDIPELLYRQLQEAARCRGCSARSLILHSIERKIHDEQKGPRTRIKVPLVPGQGEPIQMTNEEIYNIVFS